VLLIVIQQTAIGCFHVTGDVACLLRESESNDDVVYCSEISLKRLRIAAPSARINFALITV